MVRFVEDCVNPGYLTVGLHLTSTLPLFCPAASMRSVWALEPSQHVPYAQAILICSLLLPMLPAKCPSPTPTPTMVGRKKISQYSQIHCIHSVTLGTLFPSIFTMARIRPNDDDDDERRGSVNCVRRSISTWTITS